MTFVHVDLFRKKITQHEYGLRHPLFPYGYGLQSPVAYGINVF